MPQHEEKKRADGPQQLGIAVELGSRGCVDVERDYSHSEQARAAADGG